MHLLCALSRTCEAAELVKELKRGSSLWLKTKGANCQDFAWQNRYGIFSIGFSQIPSVRDYIAGREEHHRKVSFQDEFRQLLRRYEIEFTNGTCGTDATLLGLGILLIPQPGVARFSQPWAE